MDPTKSESQEVSRLEQFIRYGFLWERFLAAVIDGVILGSVIFLINHIIHSKLENLDFAILFSWKVISEIFWYGYFIFLHGFYGMTIGKRFMGLKVIDKGETKKISIKQALLRDSVPVTVLFLAFISQWIMYDSKSYMSIIWLEFAVAGMGFVWFITEILTAATNSKRKAIHDMIAGTVVVKS